jgi:hypothetical protein
MTLRKQEGHMTAKIVFTALALTILPATAFATCSGKTHLGMSCAEGTVWDADSRTCVEQVSS